MAEEAALETKRSELERKRVTAHQAGTQNRQLRDMLAWQRLLARSPLDPVIRCASTPLHHSPSFTQSLTVCADITLAFAFVCQPPFFPNPILTL